MLVSLMATLSATVLLHAEEIEKDLGIPFYPGSRQDTNYAPLGVDKGGQSFRNINLITPDNFSKVLAFYQGRLGKFSIFKSQTSAKSALWNESNPQGYRILTLVGTQEGTKITITKRTW
jgi:hypothetical protein